MSWIENWNLWTTYVRCTNAYVFNRGICFDCYISIIRNINAKLNIVLYCDSCHRLYQLKGINGNSLSSNETSHSAVWLIICPIYSRNQFVFYFSQMLTYLRTIWIFAPILIFFSLILHARGRNLFKTFFI